MVVFILCSRYVGNVDNLCIKRKKRIMASTSNGFTKDDGVDLRDLMEAQIANLKSQLESNDKYYDQRFENIMQQTQNALVSSDKAIRKSDIALEKRLDGVNEFRAQMADQAKHFLTKAEFDARWDALKEDKKDKTALWFSLFGVAMAIISLVLRFIS